MDRDDIILDLNEHYGKKTLNTIAHYMKVKAADLNKSDLINLVVDNLYQHEKFSELVNNISYEAQKVIYHLSWYGVSTLRYIDSCYLMKITLDDFYGNTDDPFIKQFKSYYSKEILLSNGLRYLFKLHLPHPQGLEVINSVERPAVDGDIVLADDQIIENLKAVIDFIAEDDLYSRCLENRVLLKTIK